MKELTWMVVHENVAIFSTCKETKEVFYYDFFLCIGNAREIEHWKKTVKRNEKTAKKEEREDKEQDWWVFCCSRRRNDAMSRSSLDDYSTVRSFLAAREKETEKERLRGIERNAKKRGKECYNWLRKRARSIGETYHRHHRTEGKLSLLKTSPYKQTPEQLMSNIHMSLHTLWLNVLIIFMDVHAALVTLTLKLVANFRYL